MICLTASVVWPTPSVVPVVDNQPEVPVAVGQVPGQVVVDRDGRGVAETGGGLHVGRVVGDRRPTR